MSRRPNPRSVPVSMTGNVGLSGPLSRAQAVKMEEMAARRRDVERRRRDFWTDTSNYFDVLNRQNEIYDAWNRPEAVSKSEMNYQRERSKVEDCEAKEEERLHRRNTYLDGQRKEFEAEARMRSRQFRQARAAAPPSQSLHDLRDQYERLQKIRFERQQKEVEEKMLQHYKINNPEFRELQFKTRQKMVQRCWEEQAKEDKERKEAEKKREEEMNEREKEMREREENKRREEEVIREKQIEVWKEAVRVQKEELLKKREEERRVKEDIRIENQRHKELAETEGERKKIEERRKQHDLGEYLQRQHRVKLLARAREVEEELEDDQKILERVKSFEAKEKGKEEETRAKELKWLKGVLEQQREEEKRRRKEMDLLFTEEAKDMWEKQEKTWNQEKELRQKLMDDVLSTLKEQTREKLKLKERRKEDIEVEKKLLEDKISSLEQDIEMEERDQLKRAEMLVQDLDQQVDEKRKQGRDELRTLMAWEEKCRSRNELAQRLTKIAMTDNQKDLGITDFRRKKVKWY